jgi:glycosyltransferase involved in cell wall biosynthesis
MRTGFRYAAARGYDVVVQVDADGQHDPEEVGALLSALDDADIVIGSRFAGKGAYKASGPRKYAMVALSMVFSRLARRKITDVTSGFKAMGPKAIRLFASYYPAEYLGDTVESLVMAIRAKLVIAEVPVVMRERAAGTPSHSPVKSAVYLGRAGLALLLALVRRRPSVDSSDAA